MLTVTRMLVILKMEAGMVKVSSNMTEVSELITSAMKMVGSIK